MKRGDLTGWGGGGVPPLCPVVARGVVFKFYLAVGKTLNIADLSPTPARKFKGIFCTIFRRRSKEYKKVPGGPHSTHPDIRLRENRAVYMAFVLPKVYTPKHFQEIIVTALFRMKVG